MCSKCDENARVATAAALDDIGTREVFSVHLLGEFMWFDVGAAKKILGPKSANIPASAFVTVAVSEVWEMCVGNTDFNLEHLEHVDMSDPPIIGCVRDDKGEEVRFLLDAIHRFARAHRDGIALLKCVALSPEYTVTLKLDAETMILERLITDMMLTGTQIHFVDERMVMVGGRRLEERPDDHPIRRKLMRQMYAGLPIDIPEGAKRMNDRG